MREMNIAKPTQNASTRIVAVGFAVFPEVFSGDEMSALAEELEPSNLSRSKAGIRHAMRHHRVAALARDGRLLGIVREFLGPRALPYRATLFDKSPASNWLVVWHQDTALPLREKRDVPGWGPWSVKDSVNYAHAPAKALEQVLALRVHLDDSTAANGPLRVLPGTHVLGVLTDEEIHELSTEIEAEDCPVPFGGVLAMRPLIVHASSKSQSKNRRRVLHIEYAASTAVADGLELAIT
jgi:ectoine hydroxylase-related dioxygenase (phytanoyl-CoA dioxygenase family)